MATRTALSETRRHVRRTAKLPMQQTGAESHRNDCTVLWGTVQRYHLPWWRHLVNAYEVRQAWCLLQVKLCDPCLSALKWPLLQHAPSASPHLGSGTPSQKLFVPPHLYLNSPDVSSLTSSQSLSADHVTHPGASDSPPCTTNNGAVIQVTDLLIDWIDWLYSAIMPISESGVFQIFSQIIWW